MCQASVYLDNELYLEEVVRLESDQKKVNLITLFEPSRELEAEVKAIDLLNGRIQLSSVRRQ